MFKKIFLVLVISLVFIGSFAGWVTAESNKAVTIDFLNFSSSGDNAIYLEEMKKFLRRKIQISKLILKLLVLESILLYYRRELLVGLLLILMN